MVVEQSTIDHIMRGLQSTEGVRLHNHRKKLRQRFDIIKKLGQGTYGKVQLGINKETGQEVAIKTIKKCKIETEADLVRIRREIQIMSSVRHPNIIHIYEVFENREKMVLVMEYAAGGELYDFLNERKVLEETEARRIFRQISTAVYYCHKHKICHRDLKLENILLDEHGSAKIADFGLSNVYEDKRLLQTFCGSPLYASPEIVRGTPYRGPEVDCWSLGVLLYTLVYGAMPFDGSNFKRLVKQISNGEYFEPKKPKASPASPLIKDMLTVDPGKRASIEQICSHWWVNQGFNVSCLDIAEDLANQTPVRLDLLLSLAPPPENSEKVMVTDDQASMSSQEPPPRSMSVGSLLDLNSGQESRRLELLEEKGVKRKVETAPSETSIAKNPPKKKEILSKQSSVETTELSSSTTASPGNQNPPECLVAEAEVGEAAALPPAGEAAAALPEEAAALPVPEAQKQTTSEDTKAQTDAIPDSGISSDKPTRKSVKTVKKKVTKDGTEVKKKKSDSSPTEESKSIEEKDKVLKKESRASEPREEVGKEIKREGSTRRSRGNLKLNLKKEREKSEPPATPDEAPTKPMERRKSKIFETAEKFMSPEPKSPTVEKPKKVFIPGVKVSDFAKAFERKSSIPTSTPVLKISPSKKTVPKPDNKPDSKDETQVEDEKATESSVSEPVKEPAMTPINDEKLTKMKESARSVIANALVEEERKKLKKQILKPPVPRTKTEENVNSLDDRKKSLTLQIGKEKATVELHSPENTRFLFEPEKTSTSGDANKENGEGPKEKKTAKVNITLKSNTLPRRTSKAEIQLSSPGAGAGGAYRTEVEHRVGDAKRGFRTQRSEVAFPVSAAQKPLRSVSLEPEGKRKERIIPIQVEEKAEKSDEARDRVTELERQDSAARGRPPPMPYQRTQSQRSSSLSRQSTQDSDTESTMSASGDPIRKSPREFIIPIAVEGGGYVTPRATSLEPSESMSKRRPFPRRISLFSDNGSEDESSWRHDLDEPFRLHRLRSSRTARAERADSLSGSEDDEDDGFEILTAENLFSTLLSRVQSLTQRLNVEPGGRPGFPSPRLPTQRLFSGIHEPLTRLSERSLSRDMDGGRWPRGPDVSDSIRSVPRDRSRGRQSESNMESVSGRRRGGVERRSLRSNSHSRTRTPREDQHPSPAQRSLSDAASSPSRPQSLKSEPGEDRVNLGSPSVFSRSRSVREETTDEHSRPAPSHTRSQSDTGTGSTSIAVEEQFPQTTGLDFYDILAEKYGVVPMKRYDLEPRRRRSRSRDSRVEATEPKEVDAKPEAAKAAPSASPSRSKKEATPSERYQTPSEKLAAVLSQLEGSYDRKEEKNDVGKEARGIPNDLLYPKKEKPKKGPTEFLKIENDRLKDLSPKALELYEKTLGLYQKSLSEKKGKETEGKKSSSRTSSDVTPELLRDEYFKNKKLKHYGGFVKATGEKEGTPVDSFKTISSEGESVSREESPSISKKEKLIRRLSRELENEMNSKDDVLRRKPTDVLKQDDNLIKRLSKELEKEMEKEKASEKKAPPLPSERNSSVTEVDAPQDQTKPTVRAKLLTSLDRKLDKLRPPGEKKYIDKAIRSLRESSVGPKEVVSENFLIKRAVSLSECTEPKTPPIGAIQSTVNSVLGFFKKMDTSDPKAKQGDQAPGVLLESTPPMLTPETSPAKDAKSNSSPKKDMSKESPVRKLSGNNSLMSFNDSSSFVSPDSESFDSWSNCSDFGTPDELLPTSKPMSPVMRNYGDESPSESVSERIRRKSFYTRFNERKKSRKSVDGRKRSDGEPRDEIPAYTKSVTQNLEKVRSPQPYVRSSTSADYSRKWYDDSRPRPFYKSDVATSKAEAPYRKTSLDWSKTLSPPTFVRSHSQSSSVSVSGSVPTNPTLPRSYVGSYDSLRRPPLDGERPFSPTRLRTPGRPFSPSSPSPTFDL